MIISEKDIEKGIEMAEDTIKIFERYHLKQPAKEHKKTLDIMIQRATFRAR